MNVSDRYKCIKAHLASMNFHFLDEWVTECVDYYMSSNPGISLEQLKSGVVQQWLLVNLRDLSVPCLPPNLAQCDKMVLPHKYAVQVESIIDAGHSSYTQYQKVKKISTMNIEVTRSKDIEQSTRCVWLSLCDGVQEVKAMEYKPIKSIGLDRSELMPGFKMIIVGPVTVRKGVLLLSEENIKICGGEVDTLVISNSFENILARRLGVNENTSQINIDNLSESTERNAPIVANTSSTRTPVPTTVENQWETDNDLNLDFRDEFFDSEDVTQYSVNSIANQHGSVQSQQQNRQTSNNSNTNQHSIADDFPDDEDLEDFVISQDEVQVLNSFNNSNSNHSNTRMNETQYVRPFTSRTAPPSGSSTEKKENLKTVQTSLTSFFTQQNNQENLPGPSSTQTRAPPVLRIVDCEPFIYLKQIVSTNIQEPVIVVVKAEILTLNTKLTLKEENLSLSANISDGSFAVDVNFSSNVLEQIIGFSGCEIQEMKKQRLQNPSVTYKIKQAFESAQKKLISLNCLMKIKFFPNYENKLPNVLHIKDITSRDVELLKKRH